MTAAEAKSLQRSYEEQRQGGKLTFLNKILDDIKNTAAQGGKAVYQDAGFTGLEDTIEHLKSLGYTCIYNNVWHGKWTITWNT